MYDYFNPEKPTGDIDPSKYRFDETLKTFVDMNRPQATSEQYIDVTYSEALLGKTYETLLGLLAYRLAFGVNIYPYVDLFFTSENEYNEFNRNTFDNDPTSKNTVVDLTNAKFLTVFSLKTKQFKKTSRGITYYVIRVSCNHDTVRRSDNDRYAHTNFSLYTGGSYKALVELFDSARTPIPSEENSKLIADNMIANEYGPLTLIETDESKFYQLAGSIIGKALTKGVTGVVHQSPLVDHPEQFDILYYTVTKVVNRGTTVYVLNKNMVKRAPEAFQGRQPEKQSPVAVSTNNT